MLRLDDLAAQRALGLLLDALGRDDFWLRLTRLLAERLHFDNWVVLCLAPGQAPQVLAECACDDGQPDPLFADYLAGLFLLDPFYLDAMEQRREGLVRLDEVAPDCFRQTDYYRRYFRLNIVEDEVQLNALLPGQRTLCLSLGSHQRFGTTATATLSLLGQWLVPLMRQRWLLVEQAVRTAPLAPPLPQPLPTAPAAAVLTAREREISQLMLSGHSSKRIAQRLGIATDTVKAHRKHLYTKLGINSQGELFALFLQGTAQNADAAASPPTLRLA